MDPSFSLQILGIFFGVALTAGFIDAIAGGGGLITIPILLLLHIPPLQALATNKVQGSFGTLTASLTMLQKRVVGYQEMRLPFVCALLGAAIGTTIIQWLSPTTLDAVIPTVLILIALYFALAPKAGDVKRQPRLSRNVFNIVIVPIIGFYDGIFGPGTGSFFSLSGVALRGETLIVATGMAKILNFATNLASAIVFILGGKVIWPIAGAMIAGQTIGAYAGSHTALKGGTRLIRPVTITMCLAMTARYLWQKGLIRF